MKTKCAKCEKLLEIACPACYVAKIKGRFFCLECYYKEKMKKGGKYE